GPASLRRRESLAGHCRNSGTRGAGGALLESRGSRAPLRVDLPTLDEGRREEIGAVRRGRTEIESFRGNRCGTFGARTSAALGHDCSRRCCGYGLRFRLARVSLVEERMGQIRGYSAGAVAV